MTMPTQSQIYSFGRHVISYAMGGISFLAIAHVISPSDASNAGNAVNQISSGITSIIAGFTTLISLASGLYAAYTASPLNQLLSVAKLPNTTVVTEKSLADALPANVKPNTEVKVVSK